METCVFCQIAQGQAPAHIVWEDDQYLAFLSIFPNTEGVTVVIPKKHYPSYAFDLPPDVLAELVLAAQQVGKKLDAAFTDVGRTGLVFEGFGVNHVHAKLFPLHGTQAPDWKPHSTPVRTFFPEYPGYLSTHDGERADDQALSRLAERLRA
jgi:histidine triad (HIT) family protein